MSDRLLLQLCMRHKDSLKQGWNVTLRLTVPGAGCRTSKVGGGPLETVLSSAIVLRQEADANILIAIRASVHTHRLYLPSPFKAFPNVFMKMRRISNKGGLYFVVANKTCCCQSERGKDRVGQTGQWRVWGQVLVCNERKEPCTYVEKRRLCASKVLI